MDDGGPDPERLLDRSTREANALGAELQHISFFSPRLCPLVIPREGAFFVLAAAAAPSSAPRRIRGEHLTQTGPGHGAAPEDFCKRRRRGGTTPLSKPLSIPPVNANPFEGYIRPATGNRILLGTESMDRQEWKVNCTYFQMSKVSAPTDLRDRAIEKMPPLLPALAQVGWETEHVGLLSFSYDG